MNEIPFPVKIRLVKEKDLSFVFGAWIESYKQDAKPGSWLSILTWNRYRKQQNQIISNILKTGKCVVACLPDDDEHIIGFAVGDKNVLHFTYIRPNRRKVGLGKNLIKELEKQINTSFIEYSHVTNLGLIFVKNMNMIYNPLSIFVN